MTTVNILDFLTKLDSNLNYSIDAFEKINKNGIEDKLKLYEIIQKNSSKLYKYLEYLKQLEYLHFTNNIKEREKFILSFDMDNENYDKNFKKRLKDDNKVKINIHKLNNKKEIIPLAPILEKTEINTLGAFDISPNKLNLPVIKDLKDIPPMFYWYAGDAIYKKGIYVCMAPGFTAKVPFPNVVSTINQNFKLHSTPCKYETKEACLSKKKQISEIHKSEIRSCSYVHKKEKFAKIGAIYRCNIDSFGNYESLDKDIKYITLVDIKRILMYSLSDSLLTTIWYQNQFKDGNLILNNIDTY